jgi:hypothetical protein
MPDNNNNNNYYYYYYYYSYYYTVCKAINYAKWDEKQGSPTHKQSNPWDMKNFAPNVKFVPV